MATGAIGEQVAQQARIGGLVLFYEKLCKLGERMQVLPYGFPVPVVSGDGEQGAQSQQAASSAASVSKSGIRMPGV